MKFGVNLLLYGDRVTPALLDRFGYFRDLGFDGLEIPVFEPGTVDTEQIRQAAERHGLALTTSGAPPPGSRLYGDDSSARSAFADYIRGALRVNADLGSRLFVGPLYKPVGEHDQAIPLEDQREQTANAWRGLIAEAEEHAVTIGFEPLNRFETDLINTTEQGIAFCRRIGNRRARLLLDTFHMHIEEKDTAGAIEAARQADVLAHFHASENDRGTAGSGQVHWEPVVAALGAAGYDGWCVLESFDMKNQAIKTAVSCWRPFYESPEAFCRDGLAFVRNQFRSP